MSVFVISLRAILTLEDVGRLNSSMSARYLPPENLANHKSKLMINIRSWNREQEVENSNHLAS
jgi:hypothetical protein